MKRQFYKAGDKVIMIMIEWVDDEQERTVEECRISLPNVVSGAFVLRVMGSRAVGGTSKKNNKPKIF